MSLLLVLVSHGSAQYLLAVLTLSSLDDEFTRQYEPATCTAALCINVLYVSAILYTNIIL